MRRIALTAAGLALVLTVAPWVATAGAHKGHQPHTCSATDRQFIETAGTNMAALGLWGQQYLSGDAKAADVLSQAKQASQIVQGMSPSDPSLAQTRTLMLGMFAEYSKAIRAQSRHREAGPHMYRAYGLANFAHTVLESAASGLAAKGCDVRSLL